MQKITYLFLIFIVSFLFTGCAPVPEPVDGDSEQVEEGDRENEGNKIKDSAEPAPADTVAPPPEQSGPAPIPELNLPEPSASVQAAVRYVCDAGKSYILYEPGQHDPNHTCELDALHTDKPADWNSRVPGTTYCRDRLKERIPRYNCAPE